MTSMSQNFVPSAESEEAEWLNLYRYPHGRSHCGMERWPSREEADEAREEYFSHARDVEGTTGNIVGYDLEAKAMDTLPFFNAKRVRDTTFCWAKDCKQSFAVRVK